MRNVLLICALLLGTPGWAATYKLQASDFTYEGFFRFPNNSTFNNNYVSMDYASDCMGETDPSPSDGYPGCLMGANGGAHIVMCDIVPPTLTGSNTCTSVFTGWDVGENLPEESGECCTSVEFQFTYDNSGTPCRVVWAYYSEYANSPQDDQPFWGYSDCSLTTPNAQGMYRWTSQADTDGAEETYRATKYGYHFRRIPSDIATDYFSGNEMSLGPGKSHGSRGSSAGPSLAIRPWTFPTDADGWDDLVAVMWYSEGGAYPKWYVPSKFTQADGSKWLTGQDVTGAEWIRITVGGDDYEALIFTGLTGVVDSSVYPLSDPDAAPTEGSWGGATYQSPGANPWPDPDLIPVHWYGVNSFVAPYDGQDPSFTDEESDGDRMPADSNIVSYCVHGTGPRTQAKRTRIWFYEMAEIGAMYQGTSSLAHDEIQPYDQITLAFDPGNDGFSVSDTCAQHDRQQDAAYAADQQLLFLSVATDPTGTSVPYSDGNRRGVVVYSVSPAAQQESSKTLEGTTLSGGSVNQ